MVLYYIIECETLLWRAIQARIEQIAFALPWSAWFSQVWSHRIHRCCRQAQDAHTVGTLTNSARRPVRPEVRSAVILARPHASPDNCARHTSPTSKATSPN